MRAIALRVAYLWRGGPAEKSLTELRLSARRQRLLGFWSLVALGAAVVVLLEVIM